mgnify:CR=1 FL=1
MKRLMNRFLGVSVVGLLVLSSCSPERSTSTGWNYNDYKNGGFEKVEDREQETGPGLVMIEGGTFTMGRTEQDVMYDWNARAARVTVASFYMDRTEVTNLHWLEYMYWMKRVYNKTYPHVYKKCLPDTLAWRSALGYREKYVNYYLRHPSYADYPVVGVSWLQANDYCKWRTEAVNAELLRLSSPKEKAPKKSRRGEEATAVAAPSAPRSASLRSNPRAFLPATPISRCPCRRSAQWGRQ